MRLSWAALTHSCGHQVVHEIETPGDTSEDITEACRRLKAKPCPACRLLAQAQEAA